MNSYKELRAKYPTFTYEGYDVKQNDKEVEITYHFAIDNLAQFAPQWRFPAGDRQCDYSSEETFARLIFSLGMVELVSYWKIA